MSTTLETRFLPRLLRRPLAVVCIGYLGAVAVAAVVAPILLPAVVHEQAGNLLAVQQGPSFHHLLGTDNLGRDVLERLLVGSRVTIVGVFEALLVTLVLGVPVGLAAGYFGGWLDRLVSWLADLTFSMPAIIIALVVLSVFPQSMTAAMVTLGVISSPGLMRVVRSATLPVREELYVAAARVAGLSRTFIVTRHVLPRVAGAVIVQASLLSAVALLFQTGLAFLGLVVAPPAPSWGGMVADGLGVIALQPWLIWPSGLAIGLTVLALGLLGDTVRDVATQNWQTPVRKPRRPMRAVAKIRQETPSGSTLLSIRNLDVSLVSSAEQATILDKVTLDVHRGETVGLVGESGCGKTMTAMSILGLLPSGAAIAGGQIIFGGLDLVALRERDLHRVRGRQIALVSQEPMVSLNPAFRVGWQIAQAVRQHQHASRRAARQCALELLRLVGLPDPDLVARRYPHELSGGMAQRVAIARALTGEPELLIADEPTTALDVTVQADILDLLRDLQHQSDMAVLLVTHDWGVVADICDRAVVMYAGQVVEQASLLPIFREPLHPYTKALLASDPHNATKSSVLPSIPGSVPGPGTWPLGCRFHPRCQYADPECAAHPIPLKELESDRTTRCIRSDQLHGAR